MKMRVRSVNYMGPTTLPKVASVFITGTAPKDGPALIELAVVCTVTKKCQGRKDDGRHTLDSKDHASR